MKDIYLMNKITDELQPFTKVNHEWCKTHKWNEPWTTEWQETNIEVDGTNIGDSMEAFRKAVNI